MPILQKTIKLKTVGRNINIYKKLGYDAEYNKIIEVDIKDLSNKSNKKILVKCDYCGKEYYTPYSVINDCNDICCYECSNKKLQKVIFEKYGVTNVSFIDDINEKRKQTLLEKYGHEYTWQVPEIIEKSIKTSMERYGTEYPMQSEIIQQRARQATMKKYGVEYTMYDEEFKIKMRKALLEKYDNKILAKSTSKQQIQIAKKLNLPINHKFGKYLIDIYDCKNKIDIEYDGRGHDLSVRLNKISKDEFINKEDERNKFMLNNGLKIIRFVSMDDKIDLNIVKMIYNHAKIELLVKNKSIYIYNFNNKEIIVK